MAEATMDANELAALKDAAKAFDRARMKQIGSFHFAMVMGALTMWGAAETWAQVTGWAVANFVAVANAVVAGVVISSTIHEWGHFTGARLSGSESPVFEKPKGHFFMFNFPIDQNDKEQFAWMSWGGILAPWVPVILALILLPFGTLSGQVLFATLVTRAVGAGAFEVPIVRAVAEGGEPSAELGKATTTGRLPWSRNVGIVAGAACFALVWLIV
ncbi:MAG: hypothetical protein NZ808_03080 [Myxococcota bacterium]|jgi:hypothetical protein|nr:hypothetical protein [Myxococcota bacterium]